MKIALLGNPNCGKTTLFNNLTNTYQKTGNWTGVTVEAKTAKYKYDSSIEIIDLPGIYSFEANSLDEKAVIEYLKQTPPDIIINVLDGTNLERNLYLTCQLSFLKIPTIIAVNMYDQLEKNNIKLNIEHFEDYFGAKILPISAQKGTNVDKLINTIINNKQVLKPLKTAQIDKNASAKERCSYIESIIEKIISKTASKSMKLTQKIDNVIMHKVFSIPIFFCVLTIIYYLSIKLGGLIGESILNAFNNLSFYTKIQFYKINVSIVIIDLICNAIIGGLGAIFSLLPQVLILFALLCVIEQSGYASRVAFIFDRLFSSIGLNGKSIVPMMVSCGCTVSGLTATRTIEKDRERFATIFLAPIMPCGAKMAVFGYFSYAVFNGNALIASSMYFLSVFCVAIFGKILYKLKLLGHNDGTFILEIPNLKIPSIKDVFYVLIEKTKDFLIKVGFIVFVLSIILWLLKSFGVSGYVGTNVEKSFLYTIGNIIKPIFYPLGFGNWQASVGILCGIFAKEGIVETLHVLTNSPATLFNNQFSAYAFMAFILLSPPCVASLITAKRELNNKKLFYFLLTFEFISAYLVSFTINTIGNLIDKPLNLILFSIIAIITIMVIIKRKPFKERINANKQ